MKTAVLSQPIQISQASKMMRVADTQASEISAIFGWSEEQFYNFQYEQYEAFLKRALFGARIEVYNKVRYSSVMRGLWNNEWIARDEDFLNFARVELEEGLSIGPDGLLFETKPTESVNGYLYDEYLFIHNEKMLYNNEQFLTKYYHVLKIIDKA